MSKDKHNYKFFFNQGLLCIEKYISLVSVSNSEIKTKHMKIKGNNLKIKSFDGYQLIINGEILEITMGENYE